MNSSYLNKFFLPIISGILTGLSFHFPNLYVVIWFSLVPLLLIIKDQTLKNAFRSGFLSGGFFFIFIFYWLVYPQVIYGLPFLFAVSVVLLLSMFLAIFWGIFTLVANYLMNNYSSLILFLLPTIWTCLEYLRVLIADGLSFGVLAYTQAYSPLLIQTADLIGPHGITFFIILINVFIYKLILYFKRKSLPNRIEVAAVVVVSVLILSYGIINIRSVENKTQDNLKLGLMQPNIAQEVKWRPKHRVDVIGRYIKLTEELANVKDLDLIIWPETAVPFILNDNSEEWKRYLFKKINNFNTPMFIGALNKIANNTYNQALLFGQELEIVSRQSKLKLVPFGEYLPLRMYLPDLVTKLMNDKIPGSKMNIFNLEGLSWSSPICSEIMNSRLVSKLAYKNNFLINISNEAWFKKSIAPIGVWQAAIFRAVENRKAVVKVSNTGISGIINSRGEIEAQLKPFQSETLIWDLKVNKNKKRTIYNRYDDYFIYIILLFSSGLIFLKNKEVF
jgi:apolipoprotein N-acyltransferase